MSNFELPFYARLISTDNEKFDLEILNGQVIFSPSIMTIIRPYVDIIDYKKDYVCTLSIPNLHGAYTLLPGEILQFTIELKDA